MKELQLARPEPSEHAEYYGRYISLVPNGNIIQILRDQLDSTLWMMENLPESKGEYRYAPGKWTVKEVFGHVNDAERIFAYRALRMARADKTPLAGFEQDDYIVPGDFNSRPLSHLKSEFEAVRRSTIALFEPLSMEGWMRSGTASDNPFTVRALAYCIAGHELHHLSVLREKYGVGNR